MGSFKKIVTTGTVLMLLAGCLYPVPSGFGTDSRENIQNEAPEFIRTGVTTREDVLMALGEPDSAAADDSWIFYASAYTTGGIGFFVASWGAAAFTERFGERTSRLIIRFDEHGLVTQVIFESEECIRSIWGDDPFIEDSEHCLDILGNDIPTKYDLAPKRP